jgi:hypothetical protein
LLDKDMRYEELAIKKIKKEFHLHTMETSSN